MNAAFYVASAVAVVSTGLVITRRSAMHALLYLVVSFLAVALVFFAMGAPFLAALEVILYAGAIMVLFVFVVMLLNLGPAADSGEKRLLSRGMWVGPAILAAVLLAELAWAVGPAGPVPHGAHSVGPKQVGIALFGPYILGVEIASFLLLAGLVGACHLGRNPGGDGN